MKLQILQLKSTPELRNYMFTSISLLEKLIHKVKTDWSTGEILDMDADTTNNLKDTNNLNDKK